MTRWSCNPIYTVGLYAWGRKAGTEVQRQLGTKAAQLFLAHQVGSENYHKHYDQGNFDLSVFEIIMQANVQAAVASIDASSSPTIDRIIDHTRIQGHFLAAAAKKLESPRYRANESAGRW